MAIDTGNVRAGLTGAVSKAPYGSTAPTDSDSALDAAFVDAGAISEDGVTLSLPDAGDKTTIKMWQNGAEVRTLRTPSDDLPTISFTMLETNKGNVETYFGVTVTQTADHGTFDYTVEVPDPKTYVLNVLDGANNHRFYIPRGVKASVGDLVYQNNVPIGYEVTIEMEKDSTAGFNFRSWMSDLATP